MTIPTPDDEKDDGSEEENERNIVESEREIEEKSEQSDIRGSEEKNEENSEKSERESEEESEPEQSVKSTDTVGAEKDTIGAETENISAETERFLIKEFLNKRGTKRFIWVPKTPKSKVPKKVPKRLDTVCYKCVISVMLSASSELSRGGGTNSGISTGFKL
ncbi:hypothetical protein DAPPUDRAFT_117438 [Daphnia pulex]|uniref:Uncharacterized protein n=1 Tax=Daphnia pulex TaxID=6669 RepID=E9HSN2_DAPPU|nr:hypothetical protein DAPPUDRAFT_117438 [Daphnia pulex]|eukprot:EFX65257.1 hypothetical protein DAPPUDRAFT_117438 [Daphnia pulex]